MDDPGRELDPLLASPDATDLERRLLRSWQGERPTPAARVNVLAALGLASSAAGVAIGTSVAPKAIATTSALTKWTIIGAIALGAAGGGTYAFTRSTSHASPAAPIVVELAPSPQPRAQVDVTQAAATVISPAPHVEPVRAHPIQVAPAASTLTLEIAALDRARAALAGGDAARARQLVDAYEAEYPSGAFLQEADVVRIDASLRDGNRAEAERLAKRFFATYPKSPHAPRVHALLGYAP